MINLFENYTRETKDLHISLLMGGIKVPTVVINDDGFLKNLLNIVRPENYQIIIKWR